MSLFEGFISFGHKIIQLTDKTENLTQAVEKLDQRTSELKDRVLRIETLIEFAQGRGIRAINKD